MRGVFRLIVLLLMLCRIQLLLLLLLIRIHCTPLHLAIFAALTQPLGGAAELPVIISGAVSSSSARRRTSCAGRNHAINNRIRTYSYVEERLH